MMRTTTFAGLFTLAFAMWGTPATAGTPEKKITIDQEALARLSTEDQARALAIRDRLEEVTNLDRSAMDRSTRRAIREEVRALKAEAAELDQRAGGTVIYLSTAGIIIIILLLIILL